MLSEYFNKIRLIILWMFFIVYFYWFIDSLTSVVDNNVTGYYPLLREYDYILNILGSLSLFVCLISWQYKRDILIFSFNWAFTIVFSFLLIGVLALLLKDGNYWYLKYISGILVGVISYILNKKNSDDYLGLFSGFISISGIIFYDNVEYLSMMDPPEHPSISYIRTFPSLISWMSSLVFIFSSAYFLSKGLLFIKRFF